MTTNIDRYKQELDALIGLGNAMKNDLDRRRRKEHQEQPAELQEPQKKIAAVFEDEYQRWYTEAYAVIQQIIPSRLNEFEVLYQGDDTRKEFSAITFTIQNWLTGFKSSWDKYGKKKFDDIGIVGMRLQTQVKILSAAEKRFQSSLFDIRKIVQADLFDSELDAARELLKHGFLRAAGAVAGVVLEKHLGEVCNNHKTIVSKKNPGISDFNDALKSADVLEVSNWRFIQRMGDLRNLCDHNKGREPTKEDVSELIEGTAKISKTIY